MIVLSVAVFATASCQLSSVDGGEEGVFVKKPMFFGSGGVSKEALLDGSEWKVFTTDFYVYKNSPVQYEESFEDAITNNNTPVDLIAYLTLQLKRGESPILHNNFGDKWFEHNIQAKFRELVRNQVSKYDMFTLTSNREVYEDINKQTLSGIQEIINGKNMPVEVISVVVGRAKPNKMALDEMDRTASQIQAAETQNKKKEAEENRYAAEVARANADKAYRITFGLTSSEFIQLKALEIEKEKVEMIKNRENVQVDVLLGNSNMYWDIKQK
jgi:hypothetical protein